MKIVKYIGVYSGVPQFWKQWFSFGMKCPQYRTSKEDRGQVPLGFLTVLTVYMVSSHPTNPFILTLTLLPLKFISPHNSLHMLGSCAILGLGGWYFRFP